jgi:sulfur carrier protein
LAVKILVNGETKDFSDRITLGQLIGELGVRKETIVAEVNRQIIPPEKRPAHQLAEGDQVELIQFVGGG